MQQELISKNKMDKTISKIKNKLQNAQERMDLCEKKKKKNPKTLKKGREKREWKKRANKASEESAWSVRHTRDPTLYNWSPLRQQKPWSRILKTIVQDLFPEIKENLNQHLERVHCLPGEADLEQSTLRPTFVETLEFKDRGKTLKSTKVKLL